MATGEVRRIEAAFRPPAKGVARIVITGTLAEMVGGGAAVVLAILALSGVWPRQLTAIAAIAAGAAVMFEGWALAARYMALLAETGAVPDRAVASGGGLTAESLAGGAAIVLGILALLQVAALPLMLVTSIILGGALLLGCTARSRLHALSMQAREGSELGRQVAHEAVAASMGAEVLIGAAGVVLGILGLAGTSGPVLAEAAMLCLGAAALLSGSGLGARLLGFIRY